MGCHMIHKGPEHLFFMFLFLSVFMFTACGTPSKETTPEDKSQNKQASNAVNWGREINIDEMTAMAKKDLIAEIQWHVMPNILRAEAFDGKIYHIKNEDKGVDLRATLIKAGVRIGKDGILFRHVF